MRRRARPLTQLEAKALLAVAVAGRKRGAYTLTFIDDLDSAIETLMDILGYGDDDRELVAELAFETPPEVEW